MNSVILLGSGGHCKSCIDVIEAEQKYNILGIVSNDKNTVVKNYPILGTDCDLEKLKFKDIGPLIRFSTTGRLNAPSIDDLCFVLGKKRVIERISRFLEVYDKS